MTARDLGISCGHAANNSTKFTDENADYSRKAKWKAFNKLTQQEELVLISNMHTDDQYSLLRLGMQEMTG